MNEAQRSTWLTAVLGVAALACGVWALWPNLFPAPRVPTVTRTDLPPLTPPAEPDAAPRASASVQAYSAPIVRLNSASEAQIEALPGVGPALASRIMNGRPYHTLADLDAVKGIGPKLLAKLGPLVQFQ